MACVIRGPVDAPKYKDYILPLIFLKRLSDVFEDDVARLAEEIFGSVEESLEQVDEDHELVRVYIPQIVRWSAIAWQITNIGEYLTDAVRAVARENPKLQGIFEYVDFNARAAGQPIIDNVLNWFRSFPAIAWA